MKKQSYRGFSLIEVMIVMVILAIITVIAIPGIIQYIKGCRMEMAAKTMRIQMMKARYLAVSRSCRYRVVFSIGGGWYRLEEDSGQGSGAEAGKIQLAPVYLPEGVQFDATGVVGPPSDPTKEPSSPVTFTHGFMSVGPEGHWSNPGAVYFGNGTEEHLALTVNIAGRVRLWCWDPATRRWM